MFRVALRRWVRTAERGTRHARGRGQARRGRAQCNWRGWADYRHLQRTPSQRVLWFYPTIGAANAAVSWPSFSTDKQHSRTIARDWTKCPETAQKACTRLEPIPYREPGPDCRPHPSETRGPHHVGNRDPPPKPPIVRIGLRLFRAAAPKGPFMHSPTKPKAQAEHFTAKAVECLERSLRVPDPEYQRLYRELAAQWLILAHEAGPMGNNRLLER
jgi:hypothetical protein